MQAPAPIVDVVFEHRRPRRNSRLLLLAVGGAVLLHASVFAWAQTRGRSLETWSAELAMRIHEELARQDVVEIEQSRPPPPPPAPAAPAEPQKSPKVRVARSRPPPPARAGNVLSQAPRSEGPVDLTGDTFVTGSSQAYVGGVTSSSGTNQVAVHTNETDPTAPPTRTPDASRPVALDDQQWQCPWPQQADSADINQQTVVIRVVVKPNGFAERVDVVSDPGFGFGAAARACALHTRFEPARDRQGNRIAATSPPIRVRFTR